MLHLSRYHYNFHLTNEEMGSETLSDFQGHKVLGTPFIAPNATEMQRREEMPGSKSPAGRWTPRAGARSPRLAASPRRCRRAPLRRSTDRKCSRRPRLCCARPEVSVRGFAERRERWRRLLGITGAEAPGLRRQSGR